MFFPEAVRRNACLEEVFEPLKSLHITFRSEAQIVEQALFQSRHLFVLRVFTVWAVLFIPQTAKLLIGLDVFSNGKSVDHQFMIRGESL